MATAPVHPSLSIPSPYLPSMYCLQHSDLEGRINELVDGSVEDVLMLARCAGATRDGVWMGGHV